MTKSKGGIILGGHIQALGIIRILGRIGMRTIIIDKTAKTIARHSVYCSYFIKSPDEDLLDLLLSLGKEGKYSKWILFPTNDFHVKLLSRNKLKLEKYFTVSTDNWEIIKFFYNKRFSYELASNVGIPIPKTFFPESKEDLKKVNIDFPCIIKPAVMLDFYRKTKRKVFICHNYDQLLLQYTKALNIIPAEEIMIQEIIPGSGAAQFSACFLYLNGTSFVSLAACRLRQHPLDFGNATTYAETVYVPEIIHYSEKILGRAKYNGLCEVEFKKDERDGVYKFLEVNARTWKWHSIANKAGTPFIETYMNYLNGREIEPLSGFTHASFMHFLTDIPVRMKLFLKGNKLWTKKVEPCEKAVWANDDPKPWLFEKIYLFNLILTR